MKKSPLDRLGDVDILAPRALFGVVDRQALWGYQRG